VDVIAQLGVSPERAQNRNAVGVKAGSTVGGAEYLQRGREMDAPGSASTMRARTLA
jgi:hypothetical protein